MDETGLDIGHGRSSGPLRHFTPRGGDAQAGRLLAAVLGLALAAGGPAGARAAAQPDETTTDLERALVSGESATAILGRWCADHHLADPPRIVALRDAGAPRPADARVRRELEAAPGEAVAYRRVRLACGARVLSEADNWYLPSRLTAAMNQALETTDTPFGQVVRPLGFRRITLSTVRPRRPGEGILRLTAVLVAADGRRFSLVRETYLDALSAPTNPP